jgi:hypothetical protein
MGSVFVVLVVAVIIAGICWWLLSFLPLPEPFNRLARGLIIIGLVLFIIVTLYGARGLLPH